MRYGLDEARSAGLQRCADPLGPLGHLGPRRPHPDPDLAAGLVRAGRCGSRRPASRGPSAQRIRRQLALGLNERSVACGAPRLAGSGIDSRGAPRIGSRTVVHEDGDDGGDRRTGSARTGCSSRAAPCRSRRSASTPRARCGRTSSSSRSSASASTRPRTATSASAADGDPERMAARILEIVARARQDAQPRDRLRRDPAGHGRRRSASASARRRRSARGSRRSPR